MARHDPQAATEAQALYRSAVEAMSAGRFADSIPVLEKALALMPQSPEILNNLGTACWKTGATAKARQHYAKAVKAAPQNALALTNYGSLLMELGELDEAEKLLKRAYALQPQHPSVANNMGLMQCRRGDFAAGEISFKAAVAARPGWSEAQENLGTVYRDTQRPQLAEPAFRRAIEIEPRNANAWTALGSLYIELQRNAAAEEALRKALDLTPREEKAWNQLLLLLEMTNRLDEAAVTLGMAKRHFADSPHIAAAEAKILRRRGKTAEAIAVLEAIVPKIGADAPGILFFFELGQLYDEAGMADKAFAAFRRANEIQAATPKAKAIDRKAYTVLAARLKKELTPGFAQKFPATPPEEGRPPVFLVGFPRSGTTLLDQILSSHPDVYVAEEKPSVAAMLQQFRRTYGSASGDISRDNAYPAAIPRLQPGDIADLRSVFFREHGGAETIKGRLLVDKMPVNLMHAAFIHAVFPQSKFILALRHPCDCVLSCYMQAFALNTAMARFNDLEDAAAFYDELFSVWEQSARVLPLKIHSIRYEDVVADFRPSIESLLTFLGLPWNDSVLAFDSTAREKERINTPSYRQVTQKIYTRASGRWRRYRQHLEPVLDVLKPYIERYGYTLD